MSDEFAFERTWGAELLDGGGVRFRLWAPDQQSISLVSEHGNLRLPMSLVNEGWFEIVTDAVDIGHGYQFELASGLQVPDPASREQMDDVHGPSILSNPFGYKWNNGDWRGRPWNEAVIYELHTGTFTEKGTFSAIKSKLDYLVELGITAIELMPVAQFSGDRGWGYDGVLLYAPHRAYGGSTALKKLIDAAHERALMVFLDVVYNHFGPDGNYLHLYASTFFDSNRDTPWGAAIDYTQEPVRRFFIENALYWLEEFRFDGLRLDAINQIHDSTSPSILEELASTVRSRIRDREIHLTTEDERNITSLHKRDIDGLPRLYTAEWNDDFHHVAHVIATGESDGYYIDYERKPADKLARALTEGYVYQGEPSNFAKGVARGTPSAHLPPVAFVNFLQNHDQVGNRALGERISLLATPQAIDALTAILLLSPQIPLLFMGEEWGETCPFYFFADFHGELGEAICEGRRNEFNRWRSFQGVENRQRIPNPNKLETFSNTKLDWQASMRSKGQQRLDLVKQLINIRRQEIMPKIKNMRNHYGCKQLSAERDLHVIWQLGDGSCLSLTANLSEMPWRQMPTEIQSAAKDDVSFVKRTIFEIPKAANSKLESDWLPAWSVIFNILEKSRG